MVRTPGEREPPRDRDARGEPPAAARPTSAAMVLALQASAGNAAVAAHLTGLRVARQPAEGDVLPDMTNPDDRAWSNAVQRLKTITRILMEALGRNDVEAIRGQSENLRATRFQLKDAAEAFPATDVRRARYQEQADYLYSADEKLFDLAHPVENGLSLWLNVGAAASILQNAARTDVDVDFKDAAYRDAAWGIRAVEGELNDIVHDRPIDKRRLTEAQRRLNLEVPKLDLVIRGLEPGDPRRAARDDAQVPLDAAQYRFVQLLSASAAAGDIWDMLRIVCDHIDPAADPLPPNPYDDAVADVPDVPASGAGPPIE